jgi:polar amino acid transport system substrate-binding protein
MAIRNVRTVVATGAAAALFFGVTACGSDDDTTGDADSGSTVAAEQDDAIAALVPAEIAEDGVLLVGTDASYAPSEFIDTDGTTIIGFDADLAEALGQVMGLDVELQNAPFDSLVEGVKTGKYDLSLSSFTINPERVEQVDMVSYFNAGTQWAAEAGNPAGVDPDNACGLQIAVQKATVQVPDIEARSQACVDAGEPAITINQYQLQSDATNAVATGKDDAMLADSPVVAYAAEQTGGKLEVLGDIYDSAPYGVAVPKDVGDYAEAVRAAMQSLIDSGVYEQILQGWGVEQGAVATAEINPVG